MPTLIYRQSALVLSRHDTHATDRQHRDLQGDLRALGYLGGGIDGAFGPATERAVMALQYDLLKNDGNISGGDGPAAVSVASYNRSRVRAVDGTVTQPLVECISEMLDDAEFPKLPRTSDPQSENRRIAAEIASMPSSDVPVPFLVAILRQESGLKHFHEPAPGDEDTYIVVGLDRNTASRHVVTSRGYGAGQYTLFHHPPRAEEVRDFMLDVAGNLRKAVRELRDKFDRFINGRTSGTKAEDRLAEVGKGPLRLCCYPAADARYLRDCANCVKTAGLTKIRSGITPFYPGSRAKFEATQYYARADYDGVPIRSAFGCDWPYAVRRYNGSGVNSYHYQARVLQYLV
jgi:peptidoglycan hydrolase-like protein with peptidoglycan-binding domain